jgi:hypothetical protein
MHAVKRENQMIIPASLPGQHIVTPPAIGGKLSQDMIGFDRFIIFRPVAIDTIPAPAGKSPSRVTLETIEGFMNPFEKKSRGLFVVPGIRFDNLPAKRRVAVFTVNPQL